MRVVSWAPRRLGQIPSPQQMQSLADQLRRDGAIVTIEIAAPGSFTAAAGVEGRAVGAPQVVKGMVDTGASISTVSEGVAAAAGLQAVGSVPLGGVGGSSERPIYMASFGMPDYGVTIDPVEIAGISLPFAAGAFDILIGRDVLRAMRLDYYGPGGTFGLTQDPEGAPEPVQPGTEEPSEGMSTNTIILLGGGVLVATAAALIALDVI